jgi:hypothetical protein
MKLVEIKQCIANKIENVFLECFLIAGKEEYPRKAESEG